MCSGKGGNGIISAFSYDPETVYVRQRSLCLTCVRACGEGEMNQLSGEVAITRIVTGGELPHKLDKTNSLLSPLPYLWRRRATRRGASRC